MASKKTYVVVAGALVAKQKTETGEGYLYRGDAVPDAVPPEEVERLLELGLIAVDGEVETELGVPVAVPGPFVPEQVVTEPEQSAQPKPVSEMTVDELKAYAAERDIDITGATKKDEIRAAIETAEAKS